jgi:hypothetical protein
LSNPSEFGCRIIKEHDGKPTLTEVVAQKQGKKVVSGQWSVVSGQWSVVSGQWLGVGGMPLAATKTRAQAGRERRSIAMDNFMVVKQRVGNLAQFQAAFDELVPMREKCGLSDVGQFCSAHETDMVIVIMKVADVARAELATGCALVTGGRSQGWTCLLPCCG